MKKLLVESKASYLEADKSLREAGDGVRGGKTDESAIIEGAPQAALVCVASRPAFSEAAALVRWGSRAVASEGSVVREPKQERKDMRRSATIRKKSTQRNHDTQSKTKPGGGAGKETGAGDVSARAAKASRVLRVLITAFNAFLRRSSRGSRIYSTTTHVRVLDITVSLARKAIERLSRECFSSADPTIGKAAARLRGITATACLAPL
ncbi:unnamed protein product, partial [Scytosiphon promiscuus]